MRKGNDISNSKLLSGVVSMFHQIHSRILKYVTNKKAKTIYTEIYVSI